MNSYDIPALLALLKEEFAAVDDMSVALSGSLARSDFRTTTGGRIVSDLDLIPVVNTEAAVPAARAVLTPILQRIADRFSVTATAAITLHSAFAAAVHAPYRTSISGDWLCNGLGLPAPHLEAARPSAAGSTSPEALAWLLQPTTYYLAKATADDPHTNLVKARAATRHLARHLAADLPGSLDDLPRTLRNLVAEQRLEPLTSSTSFLDAPTRPGIHADVRDLVFMENQGLPFTTAALAAHPSIPN
ncbi:hypothetical protein [Streptomyces erythrochromogenes]|uniref:hypothetical protein n=1 Tax=Streptomyces erythrochromogenes TaxID=285574 RepID=UPI0038670BC9|nr:hypothetical protein OG489_00385 [Streptomyces erythrochromogenes]WSR88291.1 hypothetical protein OG489_39575 [Streptomyces erythrochromogenes]